MRFLKLLTRHRESYMTAKKHTVYLDHAATTPLDPRVFEAMLPYLKEQYGNASSVHSLGRKARFAVEDARERIAGLLRAAPAEIVFTSGGTESNNLAIKGAVGSGSFVTSMAEHEAILTQAASMKKKGHPVQFLSPGSNGEVELSQLKSIKTDATSVVSLMHVNNEIGTVHHVREIGEWLRDEGVVYHCDAVQSIGLYEWALDEMPVDLVTGSSHKFYGPKGVGFLFVRAGIALDGLIEGGAQERRRRGGTEHVAGIVGMAKALDLAVEERQDRVAHIQLLQKKLINGIHNVLEGDGYMLTTPDAPGQAAPHIVHLAFPPVDGEALDGEMLILNFDMEGICVSSGSACTSGALEPSHVLLAMGMPRETAAAALRFSLGKDNTAEEIDYTLDCLKRIVQRMRS